MESCKDFLTKLRQCLSDNVTPKELVKYGIYRSEQAAYTARCKGVCPSYFRVPQRGIFYPKEGVINFLEKHAHETDLKC